MKKSYKKEKIIFTILIILLIAINYPFLNGFLKKAFNDSETAVVTRIIDGDTIKIGNESVRLLGINCPEKGEKFSPEATKFLEEKILNKTVQIRFGKDKYDRYHRKLGYIFLNGKNINLEIVERGYANPYFPSGKNEYYPSFFSAWNDCLNKKINLCKMSDDKCASCIELSNWDVGKQIVELENTCSLGCNIKGWSVKDEGRKKFVFGDLILEPNKKIILTPKDFNKNYSYSY